MKKLTLSIIIALSMVFNLSICNAVSLKDHNLSEIDISDLNENNFLGLTKEQMLEDYEHYWKTVNENCPLISLSERQNKISEVYKIQKQKLLNSQSNLEQLECIVSLSDCLSGHKSYLRDIVGCDPALLVLPNSKIVFRYTMTYVLNLDGSCNAETGTEPDIISQNNESPLDTCLSKIRYYK